jgi:hypothetical protein
MCRHRLVSAGLAAFAGSAVPAHLICAWVHGLARGRRSQHGRERMCRPRGRRSHVPHGARRRQRTARSPALRPLREPRRHRQLLAMASDGQARAARGPTASAAAAAAMAARHRCSRAASRKPARCAPRGRCSPPEGSPGATPVATPWMCTASSCVFRSWRDSQSRLLLHGVSCFSLPLHCA